MIVYEIRVTGGDPSAIRTTVEEGLEQMRHGSGVGFEELAPIEQEAWTEDQIAARVTDVATYEGRTSVLVDIEFYSDPDGVVPLAAIGGFEEVIFAALIELPDVTEVSSGTMPVERTEG